MYKTNVSVCSNIEAHSDPFLSLMLMLWTAHGQPIVIWRLKL